MIGISRKMKIFSKVSCAAKTLSFVALCGFYSMSGLYSAQSFAETIVEKRINQISTFHRLEKVTVGPSDNFRIDVAKGNKAIFTSKKSLSPRLKLQDLKNGRVKNLFSVEDEAQGGVFSPDGQRIAFTYFTRDSRGEVCFREIKGKEIQCLKKTKDEAMNPIWFSDSELGFLQRDFIGGESEVLVFNIGSGISKIVASGAIWSPSFHRERNLLVYSRLQHSLSGENSGTEAAGGNGSSTLYGKSLDRPLEIKELGTGKKMPVHVDQPGVSGFPNFSRDGKFLYFSQFSNDTNSDQVIDSNDHGVIFRILLEDVLSGRKIRAEQLTSVDTNCSYPQPEDSTLYMTCAFEGSLDIYRVPLSGIVPASWNQATVKRALATARSYGERTLLLNSERYRFPTADMGKDLLHIYRIAVNHLLSKDWVASEFFFDLLLKKTNFKKIRRFR